MIMTLYKYPSVHEGENYPCKVVTLKEIKKRVAVLNCDYDIKEALIDDYANAAEGVIIVPAIKLLKQQLAGMDYDFDGATAVLEPEYNAITHSGRTIIVNILDDEKVARKENKSLFTVKDLGRVFVRLLSNDNDSIGGHTNKGKAELAMKGNLEIAKKALTEEYGCSGQGEYAGLKYRTEMLDDKEVTIVDVNRKLINEMIDEITNCDLNDDDNVLKILNDINVANRYWQEKLIDAPKNDTKVDVLINLTKKFWVASLSKITAENDWESKKLVGKIKHPKQDSGKEVFEDKINEIRKACMGELREVIEKDLMLREVKFETEDKAIFEKYSIDRYSDFVNNSLTSIKYLYGDITAGYIEDMNNCDDDDLLEDIKKDYKENISVLANMVRNMTSKLSPEERAAMLKYSAMKTSTGTRSDGGSQYATVLCPEEYLLMLIAEGYAEIDFAGYELIANKGYEVGEMVTFEHGIADKAIIAEDVTDTLEIREYDGHLYASKLIKDIITIPETNGNICVRLNNYTMNHEEEVAVKLANAKEVLVNAWGVNYWIVADGEKIARVDGRGNAFKQLINGATLSNPVVEINNVINNKGVPVKVVLLRGRIEDYTVEDINPEEVEDIVESDGLDF
jgi:hypothetical protein